MAVDDIWEVAIQAQLGGVQVVNVFHVKEKVAVVPSSALALDFHNAVWSAWRGALSQNYVGQQIVAKRIVPHDLFVSTYVPPVTAGAVLQASVPTVACPVITWRTAEGGRRKRGRTYIPGWAIDAYAQGQVNAAGTTRLNAIIGAFDDMFVGGTHPDLLMGVWSRLNGIVGGVYLAAGFTPCTNATPQTYIGSMGTRRVGRGN